MCHVCTVVAVWTVILCQCRWCEFFESWTRSEPGSSKGYYKQLINCILFISKPLPFLNRTLICKTIFMISTSASILDPLSFLSSKRDLITLLLKTKERFAFILFVTSIPSAPSWQWLQEHQTCW